MRIRGAAIAVLNGGIAHYGENSALQCAGTGPVFQADRGKHMDDVGEPVFRKVRYDNPKHFVLEAGSKGRR